MAEVFVGIPTLNRPLLVCESIRSVLNQTYADLRVVVSDNASACSAAGQVDEFVRELRDPRIRFHRQSTNVGEYGQGRYFFRESAGHRYFVILHDDDVLKPEHLERAVETLMAHPEASCFVANPFWMNQRGEISTRETAAYRKRHGRAGRAEGLFDVLTEHLATGFAPMSGTVFRRDALERSGFVDESCEGNYPFECDLFLLLGETRAQGWFSPEELLGFRFHSGSMRNYMGLMQNPTVVERMIYLFSRSRYSGANERRRRVVLGRLLRARSVLALRQGDTRAARRALRQSLRENPASLTGWAIAPLIAALPSAVSRILPSLPEFTEAPALPAERQ